MNPDEIYGLVQDCYGKYAKTYDNDTGRNSKVAKAFGYTLEELESIPEGANLGISCGNPLATAKLKKGEVVIDLGSGAGFDVFLAANKVGPNGKAIGIDMNKDMLERARQNAEKSNASNVTFVEAPITSIPLQSSSADCIISNCVINLVPEAEKYMVFEEIFRLLKPGGRVSVSDILAKAELPSDVKNDMALYVGCIAGASQVKDYENYLNKAGFEGTLIVNKHRDLNLYKETNLGEKSSQESSSTGDCCSASCCDQQNSRTGQCCSASCCNPESVKDEKSAAAIADYDLNEWVASFQIYAVKPNH